MQLKRKTNENEIISSECSNTCWFLFVIFCCTRVISIALVSYSNIPSCMGKLNDFTFKMGTVSIKMKIVLIKIK